MFWTLLAINGCLVASVPSMGMDLTKEVQGKIDSVVLYSDGLAQIERVEELALDAGEHALVFTLPQLSTGADLRA